VFRETLEVSDVCSTCPTGDDDSDLMADSSRIDQYISVVERYQVQRMAVKRIADLMSPYACLQMERVFA